MALVLTENKEKFITINGHVYDAEKYAALKVKESVKTDNVKVENTEKPKDKAVQEKK
jgi:hypothetical protein